MEKQYTFINLIRDVLQKLNTPLSTEEIWEKAQELELDKKLGSLGKTPWATIGARIYTDIKENPETSIYLQVSKRPARFILKSQNINQQEIQNAIEEKNQIATKKNNESNFDERDLHPLLVKYVFANPHFNCYTKTILHENSVKKVKGANEWLHPDLVGVYFPFDDYMDETRKLQKSLNINAIKLFAFEMKKRLDYSNLRQSFFQAVSNSSWANEGYLVCLKIVDDSDFQNELQRLSNAFGIGIIKLNATSISESEIVCSAKYNENIDWDTLNRLLEDSPDFKKFISDLTEDITLSKVKSDYDKIIDDEKIEDYVRDKKIV